VIGETIDRQYLIESVLSTGFSGTVYQAAELSTEGSVAIKFIKAPSDPGSKVLSGPDETAFRALTDLNYPGLMRVINYGLHKGTPYLVMVDSDGVPLTREVELAPLSMERAIHICHGVGQLLDILHQYGIAHGDLRPINVILTPTWDLPHISLTGFGSTPAQDLTVSDDADLFYIAPEQVQGNQADIRSDLYSLGAILHVLTTGNVPTSDSDQSGMSLSPSQLNSRIPSSLDDLILELVKDDAASRPANAGLVVNRLQQIGQNDLFPPDKPFSSDEPQVPGPPSWEL